MSARATLWKETALVRLFGLAKLPMLFFCAPRIKVLSASRIEILLPLNWRNRNHLRSMYFGAQAVGADTAAGLLAFKIMRERQMNVSLVFKDFKAEFLKRAEDDMYFLCEDGEAIVAAMEQTHASGERVNVPLQVTGTVPTKFADEPVSKFQLTMSLKAVR